MKQPVREQTSEPPLPIIILLGETGGGKSNFISVAGKPNLNPSPTVGAEGDVTSCTKCVRPFRVENPIPGSGSTTHVELVDTPGLDASDLRPDTDILREIAEWLQKEPGTRVAGILCMQNIQNLKLRNEMGGIGIRRILALPGVSLVTTHWSSRSKTQGELKEQQLIDSLERPDSKNILRLRFDYDNGKDSAWSIIRDVVESPPNETRGTLAERLRHLSGKAPPKKKKFKFRNLFSWMFSS
ncbi:hypothetical protein BJ912DRAFT_358989 [Pholiota molesta]|nr:hypothetical protein BJ912DRAFT_358989 [Pholiota molesta]